MNKNFKKVDVIIFCIILLLLIITITGICSFGNDQSYTITNQYGEQIQIYGNGIYKHDSYFKAPILIGTDFTVLFLVVPMLLIALIKEIKHRSIKTKLVLISIMGVILYYSMNIAFGVTYNALLLIYIALFSCSLFTLIALIKSLDITKLRQLQHVKLPSKGLKVYLVLSGISLFIAWLPDIISSLIAGKSLTLIEVYTTEITYVLDMGIISPLIFICIYLLKRKNGLGDVILVIILKLCEVIGIMLPMQTIFQSIAGIEIPLPALITKIGIFIILAGFAFIFDRKYYKGLLDTLQ